MRITTHIHGFNSIMINKVIRNINKSNISIPARIKRETPTIAMMNTPNAEPHMSAWLENTYNAHLFFKFII